MSLIKICWRGLASLVSPDKLSLFFVKQAERIKIFQHVMVDPKISWCNSEKLYGQGMEHGLVRHYPVNDERHQLV